MLYRAAVVQVSALPPSVSDSPRQRSARAALGGRSLTHWLGFYGGYLGAVPGPGGTVVDIDLRSWLRRQIQTRRYCGFPWSVFLSSSFLLKPPSKTSTDDFLHVRGWTPP